MGSGSFQNARLKCSFHNALFCLTALVGKLQQTCGNAEPPQNWDRDSNGLAQGKQESFRHKSGSKKVEMGLAGYF